MKTVSVQQELATVQFTPAHDKESRECEYNTQHTALPDKFLAGDSQGNSVAEEDRNSEL
jgi:hypothetical protein